MQTENLIQAIEDEGWEIPSAGNPSLTPSQSSDGVSCETKQQQESGVDTGEPHVVTDLEVRSPQTPGFRASSEAELIQYARGLHMQWQTSMIVNYYNLGKAVDEFYEMRYGEGVIERIAEQIELNPDTLRKIIKFSRKFERNQVDLLSSGTRFMISWNSIAQNLTVSPRDFVNAYSSTEEVGEFHRRLSGFKKKKAGKKKPSKAALAEPIGGHLQQTEERTDAGSHESHINVFPAEVIKSESTSIPFENTEGSFAPSHDEIASLRKNFEAKSDAYSDLERKFEIMNQDLYKMESAVSHAKTKLERAIEMCENGSRHDQLRSALKEVLDTFG